MNKKILCVSVLSLSLFACASNKAATSNDPYTSSSSNQASTTNSGYDNGADANVTTTNNDGNSSGENIIAENAVYFDVDKYDVGSQYDAVINYNANYLAGKTAAHIRIEGNTDDSGSVEYNLALGQRRADSVKKALISKGAGSGQIEATSNGKLMPKFSNDTMDGKAQNRRSDIVYTSQAPVGYYVNNNQLPAIK